MATDELGGPGWDWFETDCRGPIDGDCDNHILERLPVRDTRGVPAKRIRCSECGTTNSVEKRTKVRHQD